MKTKTPQQHTSHDTSARPPVVVVMGHIDHGKSSLLDYIRKTNVVAKEAGGITQHVSAYEVIHKTKEGKDHKITFLDTPGHEAFQALRMRGVRVADIAVLVVSAEDGVKPQTLDALSCIKEAGIPFIVAINKIDLPNANVDRARQSLAENEIFVEGYGGDIPAVPVSAKTGEGITELLDIVVLVAELAELTAQHDARGEGVVLESHLDTKKGVAATLVIRNGTVKQGMFVTAGSSLAPVRIMEDFSGKLIKSATFSSPIKIIGWNILPSVGSAFTTFETKKEAEEASLHHKENAVKKPAVKKKNEAGQGPVVIPIVLRADAGGSLEAVEEKIRQLGNEQVEFAIIQSGIGAVSESDIKLALSNNSTVIVGFHTKVDPLAAALAERSDITIQQFDIIYKLLEWLETLLQERRPHVSVEELIGKAKVLKLFSATKDKQVIGGKVENGTVSSGAQVKIVRRDAFLGTGKIRELQRAKEKVSTVEEGQEFGTMIESKIEIAPGDRLEVVRIVEKQI